MNQRHLEVIDTAEQTIQKCRDKPMFDPELIEELKDVKRNLIGVGVRIEKLREELKEMRNSNQHSRPSWWDRFLRKIGVVEKFKPNKELFYQTRRSLSACLKKEEAAITLIKEIANYVTLEIEARENHPEWFND